MSRTIYDACLDETDDIWDDRGAYINAVLVALHIDPDYDYDKYLSDMRGFGARLLPHWVDTP